MMMRQTGPRFTVQSHASTISELAQRHEFALDAGGVRRCEAFAKKMADLGEQPLDAIMANEMPAVFSIASAKRGEGFQIDPLDVVGHIERGWERTGKADARTATNALHDPVNTGANVVYDFLFERKMTDQQYARLTQEVYRRGNLPEDAKRELMDSNPDVSRKEIDVLERLAQIEAERAKRLSLSNIVGGFATAAAPILRAGFKRLPEPAQNMIRQTVLFAMGRHRWGWERGQSLVERENELNLREYFQRRENGQAGATEVPAIGQVGMTCDLTSLQMVLAKEAGRHFKVEELLDLGGIEEDKRKDMPRKGLNDKQTFKIHDAVTRSPDIPVAISCHGNSSVGELKELLDDGVNPMVYVNGMQLWTSWWGSAGRYQMNHVIVVTGVNEKSGKIEYVDPAHGRKMEISTAKFDRVWGESSHFTDPEKDDHQTRVVVVARRQNG